MIRLLANRLIVLPFLFGTPCFANANQEVIPLFSQETILVETATHQYSMTVEIAETKEQQAHGLKYRKNLGQDHGMLFLFPAPKNIAMWMQDTEISLDMVFINFAGEIVHIEDNTEPYSTDAITAGQPVSAVLELPAGTAQELNIGVGDTVKHRHFDQ